jgi:hypothetical protein
MLFVYNYDTNAFMAQGTNRVEVEKQLQEKFPNRKFAADTDQIALLGAD